MEADAENTVQKLQQLGWTQGSLLPTKSSIERVCHGLWEQDVTADSSVPVWGIRSVSVPCDYLVIASQICDILREPDVEPYVEALAARWTTDHDELKSASTNSWRIFLLVKRQTAEGLDEGLIADATQRITLDKASLSALSPVTIFTDGNVNGVRRFQAWLGGRFSRQPLPTDLVNGVQRHLVNAIRKLKPSDDKLSILDKIQFVLCQIIEDGPPLGIDLLLVAKGDSDDDELTEEEVAKIAGWFKEVIEKKKQAKVLHCEGYSTRTISMYYYENSFELPLGEFSTSGIVDETDVAPTLPDQPTELAPKSTKSSKRGRRQAG